MRSMPATMVRTALDAIWAEAEGGSRELRARSREQRRRFMGRRGRFLSEL
jgi:hypothetical protein